MWRLHSLFNYVRGGVRGGGWRVREPPSQLVSDDRERETAADAGWQPGSNHDADVREAAAPEAALQRCRLRPAAHTAAARDVRPAQVFDEAAHSKARVRSHLPPAVSLWYLSFGLQNISDGSHSTENVKSSPCDTLEVTDEPTACTDERAQPGRRRYTIASIQSAERSWPPDTFPRRNSYPKHASNAHSHSFDPLESLSVARIAFATEHDRQMARLQNSVGASVTAQRPAAALECFRSAAALGAPEGWYNAGVCFMEGIGTQRDMDKACVCFAEAARLGHPAAAYNLALLRLTSSDGVTSQLCDDVTALLRSAAAGGCAEAVEYLPTWTQWCDAIQTDGDSAAGDAVLTSSSAISRTMSLPALSDSGYDSSLDSPDSGLSEWESCRHIGAGGTVAI